jgi:hypothetical protein
MHYLGQLQGAGSLTCKGETVARASYDFDGFLSRPGQVSGSGEIRMSPDKLKEVFGRSDVKLLTDDGRLLSIRFSERRLGSAGDAAHVEVGGELPGASEWHH